MQADIRVRRTASVQIAINRGLRCEHKHSATRSVPFRFRVLGNVPSEISKNLGDYWWCSTYPPVESEKSLIRSVDRTLVSVQDKI